jgi:rRNA maturation protein Nop10
MRKIKRTKTYYRCAVCKTEHERRSDAAACEAGGIEDKKFRVGDMVRAVESRRCVQGHRYACRGKVVKIVGPEPYSAEVHGKGFGLMSATGHIYMYEIATGCAKCGSKTRVLYPAASLRLLAGAASSH